MIMRETKCWRTSSHCRITVKFVRALHYQTSIQSAQMFVNMFILLWTHVIVTLKSHFKFLPFFSFVNLFVLVFCFVFSFFYLFFFFFCLGTCLLKDSGIKRLHQIIRGPLPGGHNGNGAGESRVVVPSLNG